MAAVTLPANPRITVAANRNTVTLSCACLAAGKTGNITPDADGYYEIVLGGFNVNNRSGDFYPADERVKKLFLPNSALMRKAANQALKGEYQHPKKVAGMTQREWINRICTVDELLVSHHIIDLTIDESRFTNAKGQPVMTIIGKVKPCGPYGDVLRESLANPKENTAFSVRSLSINKPMSGVLNRFVTDIVTWDHVNEGGIAHANKYSSPSVEALVETIVTEHCVSAIEQSVVDGGTSFESAAIPLMSLRSALGEIQVTDLNRSSFHW